MKDNTLKVQEHQLVLEADPFHMKVISEAIAEYMDKRYLEDTTLSDFRFNMECAYQNRHSLDQDDWDYTPEDKAHLGDTF